MGQAGAPQLSDCFSAVWLAGRSETSHYSSSFPVAIVGPVWCRPCYLVGDPVQLLHSLGIGQQLAAHGIRCTNEDHRDIQMLNEMLDHLMEVTIPGGQQQRTPLPVPVRPHQVESQTDIDGLLLDVLELQAIAGVHDRSATPTRGPVDGALLQPVQLDAQARTAGRRIGQGPVEGIVPCSQGIGVRVEVVRVRNLHLELALQMPAQQQVIQPVVAVQALPFLEQKRSVHEPGGAVGH